MRFHKFTAVFEPEKGQKGVYNVSIPALPGCLTFGESLAEARYNIQEAAELYIETILEAGQAVPRDKRVKSPKGALLEEVIIGVGYEVAAGFGIKIPA